MHMNPRASPRHVRWVAVDDMRVPIAVGHIPGVLAAGESIGGFNRVGYYSRAVLRLALFVGRIAGRNAARAL